ncbi:unnamed protein product [Nyctereutes procyonoides]|uniref:(raccoon dog) hypothetical protein n=1 Tax=Nyctereutes procyonoides TaxID=34880 RepID=A0A811ZT23_NYCPR|nr:unnamed protein product [Nyctereutes procyonoides]
MCAGLPCCGALGQHHCPERWQEDHNLLLVHGLERPSKLEILQKSMLEMETISCGNITDKDIIALHRLRNLNYLLLSDLPGMREKGKLIQAFKTTLPSLESKLDLK